MKKYTKAPLPFLGQKRNWLRLINEINFDHMTVIDLFGGSGILSHEIKRNNPNARVIWNDFDNYQGRLNQIEQTEALRQKIAKACSVFEKDMKLSGAAKDGILKLIKESGTTDFITVSSWLLFSGNYCHSFDSLANKTWYISPPKNPLNAEDYLSNVERVRMDYKELLSLYPGHENTVFIADPPYIMTNQTGYSVKNDARFKLVDAIHLFKELGSRKAVLFSSTKSESDELLDLMDINVTERHSLIVSPIPDRKYEDLCYRINF
ncbi:DNA adenine methylase [Wohlfahrtiimonas chitiniclastica]|uniref:DNA adenine methylase n=1 Tax=Wohlfahrtiimonas chitiniclastica TaxID=400946 RepID=UPI0021578FFF|nr:DNA adenine methylase [Wohlfahrtiimonas chitiniclastica]MDC7252367.1 hypothetical protein [Wohlfahrtiimonas chitiniclastica]